MDRTTNSSQFSLSHKRRASIRAGLVPEIMGMPQNFLFPQRDQPLLMPVDMREWLPEDDLVFVVLDAVATLDLGVPAPVPGRWARPGGV